MDTFHGNIIICSYIIAWLITMYLYSKKRHLFDAGSCILCLYLIYAISSLLLYNNHTYSYRFFNITYSPFMFLYLSLLISFLPILNFNTTKILYIQKTNMALINIFACIFIITSAIDMLGRINTLSYGILSLFSNPSGGKDLYIQALSNRSEIGKGISNIFAIISNSFYNIGVLLLFYYCTLKKQKKLIIIGLSISCLFGILTYIATGQRGGFVKRLLTIVVTYFALKPYIDYKINRLIKKAGMIIIILAWFPFTALTLSRFGDNAGGANISIFDYAGQPNLNFNKYAFDNNGIRYGDRTFPIFKKILGFQNVPDNFVERRNKYPRLRINDEVFITYIGDFVLDFGPTVAFSIILLFTIVILFKTRVKQKRILFHQLLLIHFVICICSQGGSLFSFADTGNLSIIIYLLAYWLFKYDNSHQLYSKSQEQSKYLFYE